MRSITTLCFTLLFILFLGAQSTDTNPRDYRIQADELLAATVTEGNFAGVAAGVSVNGEIVWSGGAGYRDVATQQEADQNMVTRIASVTKPMTAVAVMQLYERGQIDLDAPIQAYLPEFPQKTQGELTTRQLLTHTAGIPDYKSKKETQNKIYYPTLAEAMAVFQDRDLVNLPGAAYAYTTYGYVVLGRIIEAVSGQNYEAYMRENIWAPAGMTHTGVERPGGSMPNQSKLYHRKKPGKLKAMRPNDLSNRVPGGGLYSTVPDLLRFGQAVLDHTLIQASTLALLWTDPGIKKDGNPCGFGFFLYGENPRYGNVVGHGGAQTGASTQLMLLPDQETVIVVLANTSGDQDGTAARLSVQLFEVAGAARADQ